VFFVFCFLLICSLLICELLAVGFWLLVACAFLLWHRFEIGASGQLWHRSEIGASGVG
jgi:hypothetical protein